MLARGFVTIEGVMAEVAPDISVIEIVSEHVIAAARRPEVFGDAADRSRHDERRFGRGLGEAADPAVEHVGDARPRADQGERRHRGVLAASLPPPTPRWVAYRWRCCRRGCSWGRLSCAPRLCSRNCSACPCSACWAMSAPSCWVPTRCSTSWSPAIAFSTTRSRGRGCVTSCLQVGGGGETEKGQPW